MTSYDLACEITRHPRRIVCDYYDALKLRQYFLRSGIKISISRVGILEHIIYIVD